MLLYHEPDCQDAFSTGKWQIGYRIDNQRTLIFVRGGGRRVPPNADREWLMGLLHGRQRDFVGEQALMAAPKFAGQVTTCAIDGGTFLVTTEKQIDAVVDAARAVLMGSPEDRATA